MAVIGEGTLLANIENRTRVEAPADEVVPGDVVRDHGIFRRIARVEPSVVELALLWFFDPVEGCADGLDVPSLASVSVWRVSDGQ